MNLAAKTGGFTLKGWHVLAALLGFFFVVTAVNIYFIAAALRSFPGQEVEKSYLQGLHYNDQIEARLRQAALGWKAALTDARREQGAAVIGVAFYDRNENALLGLDVTGELRRPSSDRADKTIDFRPDKAGAHVARIADVDAGLWDLSVLARAPGGETFEFKKRIFIE
ncbi:MAG: FixH family protein [Amphiplicatus sp.]